MTARRAALLVVFWLALALWSLYILSLPWALLGLR